MQTFLSFEDVFPILSVDRTVLVLGNHEPGWEGGGSFLQWGIPAVTWILLRRRLGFGFVRGVVADPQAPDSPNNIGKREPCNQHVLVTNEPAIQGNGVLVMLPVVFAGIISSSQGCLELQSSCGAAGITSALENSAAVGWSLGKRSERNFSADF